MPIMRRICLLISTAALVIAPAAGASRLAMPESTLYAQREDLRLADR